MLNEDGVPVVVARKSMGGPCIVACRVKDAEGALVAAKEGADLVIAPDPAVVAAVIDQISVPVFTSPMHGWSGLLGGHGEDGVQPLVKARAHWRMCLTLSYVSSFTSAYLEHL